MTLADLRRALGHPNVAAFLRVIREGESSQTDDAYRMMFGGGLFDTAGGWQHPRRAVTAGGYTSTAAGAYQFLSRTWDGLCQQYPFPDFAPKCQDMGAVALIAGRGALQDVIDGRLDAAIAKCGREWASLPGSPYGQPVLSMGRCRAVYAQYGGTEAVAPGATTVATAATADTQPTEKRMDPLSLVSLLTGVFSPIIRAKAQRALGGEVGGQLADNLLAVTQQVTGKADPLEAVAVARQQPEMVAKVEQAAADWLAQMGPVLDKIAAYDQALWKAEIEGKSAAADRTIREKDAGLWDMTKSLVHNTEGQTWFILAMLVGGLVYAIGLEKEAFFTGLIGIAGGVINQVLKNKAQANDYRFDGTKESSDQSKAIADAVRSRVRQ